MPGLADADTDIGAAPAAERSIAFGVEELVALTRVTGVALPVLGPNPLSHVRLAERAAVLDTATRSLRARNIIQGSGDDARVPAAVLGLLEIVGGAALRADALVDGGATFRRRYHAVPYASVEHEVDADLHRFTPFATEDLLARIARQVGLTRRPAIHAEPISAPFAAFEAARSAAGEARTDDAIAALTGVGVPTHDAASLVTALATGGPVVAVRITHRSGPTRLSGGEIAWLDAGERGVWLVPTIDQPFAAFAPVEGDGAGPVGDDGLGDTVVDLVPTDADAVATALFAFLPSQA